MAKKLHLIHVKSNVQDKTPSASTLNYGEIAVNYNSASPAIYIKDTNDDIVKFIDEDAIYAVFDDAITGLTVNGTLVETISVTDNIAVFASMNFNAGDVVRVEGATTNDTFTF